MGTPILHVRDRATEWIPVQLVEGIASPVSGPNHVGLAGNLVELDLSLRLQDGWTPGTAICSLPAWIPVPRALYRPPVVWSNPGFSVRINARGEVLFDAGTVGTAYRIVDHWLI